MKRVYIAGPMSGPPDYNYPAFDTAELKLRLRCHQVENPAKNPVPPCGSWLGYMRTAVAQLARCDAVVMLQGWESSRGARVEFQLAHGLGLEVMTLERLLSSPTEVAPA
jgi:hypothetical protein